MAESAAISKRVTTWDDLTPNSFGVTVTLTTKDCIPFFKQPELATFALKHLRTTFCTIGAGLAAWYLTPDQLAFMCTGVSKVDVNRLIYNFIHFTNQLAQKRFSHALWRSAFAGEYCDNGTHLLNELRYMHHQWHDESLKHFNLVLKKSGDTTPEAETERSASVGLTA